MNRDCWDLERDHAIREFVNGNKRPEPGLIGLLKFLGFGSQSPNFKIWEFENLKMVMNRLNRDRWVVVLQGLVIPETVILFSFYFTKNGCLKDYRMA